MNRKEFIQNDNQVIEQPKTFNSSKKLKAKCAKCKEVISISLGSYYKRRKNGPWECHSCIKPDLIKRSKENPLYKDPEYKEKFRKLHDNPEYRNKVHNKTNHEKISKGAKKAWKDPEKRENHLAHRRTDEFKNRVAEWAKDKWSDPRYRDHQHKLRSDPEFIEKASKRSKELWQDENFRNKMVRVLDTARTKSHCSTETSSLQKKFYRILDGLEISYFKEGEDTIVGPIYTSDGRVWHYVMDCIIPRPGKDLLIDIHGEWPHSQPKTEAGDRTKAKFINNKLHDRYEYLVLWEHEFRSPRLIENIILEKLGLLNSNIVDYNLSDVKFIGTDVNDELKDLFSTYHYMSNIGRSGSLRYVGTLHDKIISGVIYNYPTRIESAKRLGVSPTKALELTRFCIHPKYQKKNLASMTISRSVRMLKRDRPDVDVLYTFADTTYEHDGTIYKASGWKLDGETKPDYWYIDSNGAWYHKKTIWDFAKSLKLKESDYASKHDLRKIWGKKKLRFIKWL